jgi:UPF0755 protein
MLLTLFVGVFLIGTSVWMYRSLESPYAHRAEGRVVTIAPGIGARAVINELFEAGVIQNRMPLLMYLAANPQSRTLQAGDYVFDSPTTPLQVLEKIRRGQVHTRQITIPEGSNVFDVRRILEARRQDDSGGEASAGAGTSAPPAALRNVSLIADLDPTAKNLEGYLFPDTYSFSIRATDDDLVKRMVVRFHEVFTPAMRKRAQELGLTVREAVTLASLIEKEAATDEDRPLIASVFHNRLKKGMRMECDPTFMYAAMLNGSWDGNVNNPAHRRSASPYNTYVAAGLPPGPIASPGLKSLQAALYPKETDYIYFVLGEGGKHRFSRTDAEHQAAVADYRRMQREGRK